MEIGRSMVQCEDASKEISSAFQSNEAESALCFGGAPPHTGTSTALGIPYDITYAFAPSIISYANIPPRIKKKDGLRKGKWTPEEERYTNKVIETFNAGTLQLPEAASGITLRAYLADKLGCDPMRITKKYTGASCLGKRVYHAECCKAPSDVLAAVKVEVDELEKRFREKLEQTSRERREHELSTVDFPAHVISTPAIDAMMLQNTSWGFVPNSGMTVQMPVSYLAAAYASTNKSPRPFEYFPSAFPPTQEGSMELSAVSMKSPQQIQSYAEVLYPHPVRTFPNSGFPFPSHPYATSPATQDNGQASKRPKTLAGSSNNGARVSDGKVSIGPKLSSSASENRSSPSYSFKGKQAHVNGSRDEFESEGNASVGTSKASSVEGHSDNDQDAADDDPHEMRSGREASRSHGDVGRDSDVVAASSLLGFFHHLHRSNSQKDLVEFVQDVTEKVTDKADVRGMSGGLKRNASGASLSTPHSFYAMMQPLHRPPSIHSSLDALSH